MKTCAADIHKDHIEVEVIQWDEYDQIETVQQYTFKGNTDSIHLTPWDQLTKCVENRIDITFVDAGYLTKQVYLFTGQYSSGVYPIKGFHGLEGDGYWCKPKDSNNEFTIHINVKKYRAIRGYKNYQDLRLYSIAALEYFNQNQKRDDIIKQVNSRRKLVKDKIKSLESLQWMVSSEARYLGELRDELKGIKEDE